MSRVETKTSMFRKNIFSNDTFLDSPEVIRDLIFDSCKSIQAKTFGQNWDKISLMSKFSCLSFLNIFY